MDSQNSATAAHASLQSVDTARVAVGTYLAKKRTEAITLLHNAGVKISASAPGREVRTAWLKLIKDSESFRDRASHAIANFIAKIKNEKHSNFVQNYDKDFFNVVTTDDIWGGGTSTADSSNSLTDNIWSGTYNSGANNVTPVQQTGSSQSASGGGFLSALGNIFSPSVIQAGIKTGLQAYSTNIAAKANSSSELNALQLEQLKLAQAQTNATAGKGMSAGAVIGIVLGLGVVVTVIIVVMKSKKKAA